MGKLHQPPPFSVPDVVAPTYSDICIIWDLFRGASFILKFWSCLIPITIRSSIMSGSLEVAAGIFAIIGVADVVVRMGREVHGFLRDIAGAPEEIDRLCTTVKETALLAETVKQLLDTVACRKQPNATNHMVALFESALKSLQRELQNLRILSARFRSGGKTWSRVKYVLDERKISKMFNNLERSKSLLANSLHVASR